LGLLLLLLLGCSAPPPPPITTAPPEPSLPAVEGAVRVRIRLPAPETNRVEVEIVAPTAGQPSPVFRMPVWTPGSYLVRDFSRHVEVLTAHAPDGSPLPVHKRTKSQWQVEAGGAASVALRYTVYAHELSVRSAFVDRDLALLVGAALFMEPLHLPGVPYDVQVERPPAWTGVETALDPHPDGDRDRWVARDWDELIDSPIVAGAPQIIPFEVAGVPHRFAHFGGEGFWDVAAAAEDVKKITQVEAEIWGIVPYDHYVFLNVAAEAGGGLEHSDSTLMLTTRARGRRPDEYKRWLSLVAHELFHAWNVKRLRPAALGPFDYDQENYTTSLWFSEGFTSYYDDLALVRAGLLTGDEHLERLTKAITSVQTRPGHRVQSLGESSFDTWIKHYRPDENAPNREVDYYDKGALAAWLLDARIRELTADARSLDDVMRLAYQRFPVEAGFEEPALRALFPEVAGPEITPLVDALIDGVGEIDWSPALRWWGLRFASPEPPADGHAAAVWIGLENGVTVAHVLRDTPAFRAGVNVGDELIAVDGVRIPNGDLAGALVERAPGETAQLLIARRGAILTLPVTLEAAPVDTWKLELDTGAGVDAPRHRKTWWRAPGAEGDAEKGPAR
jgi:predicted metalloprotease with PDZ domain